MHHYYLWVKEPENLFEIGDRAPRAEMGVHKLHEFVQIQSSVAVNVNLLLEQKWLQGVRSIFLTAYVHDIGRYMSKSKSSPHQQETLLKPAS